MEAFAESQPSPVALVCDGVEMTYTELNSRANQLAHELVASHSVSAGTIVALLMDMSLEYLVAHMGVVKAGGAWLPMASSLPEDRLVSMMQVRAAARS